MRYVNPRTFENLWIRIQKLLAKAAARSGMLYLTGWALAFNGVSLWIMIGAKALYDPTANAYYLPFNKLTYALYMHWTAFRWLWDQGWLPEGHGNEALLSIQSVSAFAIMLSGAGCIRVARTGFGEVWQVRSEQRKDRIRGASRIMNAIQNIAAGRDVKIVQGSGSSHAPGRRSSDPSETVGGKFLLGIAVTVCGSVILLLFGLH